MAILVSPAFLSAADAAESKNPGVPVCAEIYDYAKVSRGALEAAKKTAAYVLEKAGVQVHWAPDWPRAGATASEPPCSKAIRAADLHLRILSASMAGRIQRSRGSLGMAYLTSGRLQVAAVYYHRVLDLEKENVATRGEILGCVMAHEIGHLLLHEARHWQRGIMRRAWDRADLKKCATGRLRFSEKNAKRMAASIAGRAWSQPGRAMVARHD